MFIRSGCPRFLDKRDHALLRNRLLVTGQTALSRLIAHWTHFPLCGKSIFKQKNSRVAEPLPIKAYRRRRPSAALRNRVEVGS
jgi:hypothetical protein